VCLFESETAISRWHAVILSCLAYFLIFNGSARAQELLQNPSFETPVAPSNGNNFYATLPNWVVVDSPVVNGVPVNIVRPFPGYFPGGPTTTPTANGGVQYLDINSTGGTVSQNFTITQNGSIDFSAWFSVRDQQQNLTTTVVIRNSAGTIIASASTNHLAADPIGLWRQATGTNIAVTPGTYKFEMQMDNFANADLASVVFKPALSMTKASVAFSDPLNGTTNPKLIPGAFVDYTLTVNNPAAVTGPPPIPGYSVTSGSVIVSDPTPTNLALFVGNLGGGTSGPAVFNAGTSGMAYTYTSLASATDNIEFSNNNGTSWTYTPVPDVNGVDTLVTNVRMRPTNAMPSGTSFSFRLRYRIK
jgi:hypothetical protein